MSPIRRNIKTTLYIPLILLFTYSCGEPDIGKGGDKTKKQLEISTSVQTRSVVTGFAKDDMMNLFVKTEGSVSANDYKNGVKGTFDGAAWTISPGIEIASEDKFYIYAVYPFKQNHTDASSVPLNITQQIDYLYSGPATVVTHNNPNANLTMKHALSMLGFSILPQNYIGDCNLEAITIQGEGFYITGNLNIGNGQIELGDVGGYTYQYGKKIPVDENQNLLPQFFSLPLKSDGTNINLTFKIDGKDYSTNFPQINLNAGWKYIFHMALTPVGIFIFNDKTEIISMNQDGGVINPGEYSSIKISYSSNNITLPQITGNNVAGMVYWSETEKSVYTFPLNHTFNTGGLHNINIDIWGANQIIINDLLGLEEIDLSEF